MEHLKLEIFDLATKDNPRPTGSQYAVLEENASITITDTSEIFASGDVWSHSFTLNVHTNAYIFGTSGDLHGSRLHEQINKRRARLWVDGLPLYLGYLKLDEEVDVDKDGNVDVGFESGQKTFNEMIEGTSATEVSVGDVPIGIAINRKRVCSGSANYVEFDLNGLDAYVNKDPNLQWVNRSYDYNAGSVLSPYMQQWPKIVKSHGQIWNENWVSSDVDYTNVQHPYDPGDTPGTAAHPFCNINICYPFKSVKEVDGKEEEVAGRGYTLRLGHGNPTTKGDDNQTRYNNAPNFYLLYFIDRLFKDLGIHIEENQAMDVQDLRRVFMLNFGCHYEEIESMDYDSTSHSTPADLPGKPLLSRYGQYYLPIIGNIVADWYAAGRMENTENTGKVLLRDLSIKDGSEEVLSLNSVEGVQHSNTMFYNRLSLVKTAAEASHGAYSAYKAYATGENYPNVEISEIVNAMKSMFGVRLLFNNDFSRVRIILLRNIFNSSEVQLINCDIEDKDVKVENCIRGFRMTYGKGKEDASFYYKGFSDVFEREKTTWKDTTDKHDYSQWKLDADYNEIKQSVSAINKTCYVTPITGNAFGVKIDEEEEVLFPSLFEYAGFMDAEDGDCSGQSETIEEVQCGASPVIMNDVGITYALLFSGEMKAPTTQKIRTMGRVTTSSGNFYYGGTKDWNRFKVSGKIDVYLAEGFDIYLADNYSIGNSGTPFDDADPGLQFGIMRSSGYDAFLQYGDDPQDEEGNDTWDIKPGSNPVSHPDTCDCYGNLWDYDGTTYISNPQEARTALQTIFPNSNAALYEAGRGYIQSAITRSVEDNLGVSHCVMFVLKYSNEAYLPQIRDLDQYINDYLRGHQTSDMLTIDRANRSAIIEIDSSRERVGTLLQLELQAYGGVNVGLYLDPDGVGSLYGRFSLKLRAEKLNPYYEEGSSDPDKKDRYLSISNPDLRQRGLADQFYKEYSYWVRNARILKRTVHMTLAQLLSIDKTKKVRVGDITGFIRKMQYSVSNKTGLGEVTMEIMYI